MLTEGVARYDIDIETLVPVRIVGSIAFQELQAVTAVSTAKDPAV